MTRYGYRYFYAYGSPSEREALVRNERRTALGRGWAPLAAPYTGCQWPEGWVTATCEKGCTVVPGSGCECGFTFLDELARLASYMLAVGEVDSVDLSVDRLVVTRVEVRGRVTEDYPSSPEKRGAEAQVVEAWLPASGARFASVLEDHYGIPVHVGDSDGRAWLNSLCPDGLPDDPRPEPASIDHALLQKGIELMETFEQTPHVQASIRRARKLLRQAGRPHVPIEPGFRVSLRHVPTGDRADELQALADALRTEFPAFRARRYTDLPGARVDLHVEAKTGTPVAAAERLDGWGHGRLTLRRAALAQDEGCIEIRCRRREDRRPEWG